MSDQRRTCLLALCGIICCSDYVTLPTRAAEYEPSVAKRRARQLTEAAKAGNIDLDLHADWIDYTSAGVEDRRGGCHAASPKFSPVSIAKATSMDWGCAGVSILKPNPDSASRLLEARQALARRLAQDGISHLVETYDVERFNRNASVAENLLFGTPIGPAFDFDALADNNYVLQVLAKVGLIEDLVEAGREVAATMVELFADLPSDHAFFEQYSFIDANDLPEFAAILDRAEKGGTVALSQARSHKAAVTALQAGRGTASARCHR